MTMTSITSHSITTLPSKLCHLKTMRIFVGIDIAHKSSLDITHKTQLNTVRNLYKTTLPPQ